MDLSVADGPGELQRAPPRAEAEAEAEAHTSSEPISPFRLFDLPRELRDIIYDYALVPSSTFLLPPRHCVPAEEESSSNDLNPPPASNLQAGLADLMARHSQLRPNLNTGVRLRPYTGVLLSSKCIKDEYEKRAKLAMTLVRESPFSLHDCK